MTGWQWALVVVLVALVAWALRLTSTGWVRRDKKGGWIRLWPNGPGWGWNFKAEHHSIASVRRWSIRIGKWRVWYLRSLTPLTPFGRRTV